MADEFICPECEKPLKTVQALGSHRARAHGVAGKSRGAGGSRRPSTPTPRASNGNGRKRLDRDALLQTVFPEGIPPREDLMKRAGAWLDEAEQLVAH